MMCPDEKLILVEIILLKILGINSNFVFRVRRGGVARSARPDACLRVCHLPLWHSIITRKLQPFSACGQSCSNGFEGDVAPAARLLGVTLNWLNIVILGSIID